MFWALPMSQAQCWLLRWIISFNPHKTSRASVLLHGLQTYCEVWEPHLRGGQEAGRLSTGDKAATVHGACPPMPLLLPLPLPATAAVPNPTPPSLIHGSLFQDPKPQGGRSKVKCYVGSEIERSCPPFSWARSGSSFPSWLKQQGISPKLERRFTSWVI